MDVWSVLEFPYWQLNFAKNNASNPVQMCLNQNAIQAMNCCQMNMWLTWSSNLTLYRKNLKKIVIKLSQIIYISQYTF